MINSSLSTFRISRGIGQYHSSDHFAVLGLPVTANASQIRQRYLTIVRRLHPDVYGLSADEKEVACEYLTKLVSPAYNTLINERERAEYSVLIRLIAKRLIKQDLSLSPVSAFANKLLSTTQEFSYEQAVEVVAGRQYESLQQIMTFTSQLSELNLVYLVKSEGYNKNLSKSEEPAINIPPVSTNQILNIIKKSEELIAQKQWVAALNELRETLKQDNTNAKVHALLGVIYLNQKLEGMAKISFQQALKNDPKQAIALEHLNLMSNSESTKVKSGTNRAEKNKSGGFFGWLGGS
jgi:curved DNA-binding protein CbpA